MPAIEQTLRTATDALATVVREGERLASSSPALDASTHLSLAAQKLSSERSSNVLAEIIARVHTKLTGEQRSQILEAATILAPRLETRGIKPEKFFGREFNPKSFLEAQQRFPENSLETSAPFAASLTWIFGKDWDKWMGQMAKPGVDEFRAAWILPFPNRGGNEGLKEFLFRHTRRLPDEPSDVLMKLEKVGCLWSKIAPRDRSLPLAKLHTMAQSAFRDEIVQARQSSGISFDVFGRKRNGHAFRNAQVTASLADRELGSVSFDYKPREVSLHSLWVDDDARRLGIAQELIGKATDSVPKKTERAVLDVFNNNLPAINLYKKLGFSPIGEFGNITTMVKPLGDKSRIIAERSTFWY